MAAAVEGVQSQDRDSPFYYRTEATALLLLDFHALFVDSLAGPNGRGAVRVAAELRTWAVRKGIRVVHCLVDADSVPFATCRGGAKLAKVLTAMKDSGKVDEPEELTNGGGDKTFTRRVGLASALKSDGLPEYLRREEIASLVIAGLSTGGGVLRTAMPATDEGFVTTVISDACADPVQEVHETVLGKLLTSRAWVMSAQDFKDGHEANQGGA
ncbi:hypothetical protein MRB53_040555 [Persea americana]|nr:hypothetical protein MRB53_040555 [Persea americana]